MSDEYYSTDYRNERIIHALNLSILEIRAIIAFHQEEITMKNLIYTLLIAIFVALPSESFAQKELEGLVLYYSFDEVTGDKVKDLSPSKKDGTLIKSPKLASGKFGKALEFGGPASGQYVDVGYHKELEADNAVTVMTWIFPDWIAPAPGCCMQVYGFGVHGGCGGRVQHGVFTEDGLKARFETEGGVRIDILAPLPESKKWVHVAATFEDGKGKMYLDGKLISEGSGNKVLVKSNEPLFIAADCERLNYIFNGIIDEFRMFKRALSEKEINFHMGKGRDVLAVDAAGKLTITWSQIKSAK
ncbi:LamG domain-containing protein [Candidatus Poribacteria bacterium]|nr:LamG domain-containing protein [Candidatus Poribacteria bacterium]